jgi:hypothetical protein
LSFERPAKAELDRAGPVGHAVAPAPPTLFADLENCTVANDTGITGRSLRASPKITVKIVRAHGGCLGTKSRRRT